MNVIASARRLRRRVGFHSVIVLAIGGVFAAGALAATPAATDPAHTPTAPVLTPTPSITPTPEPSEFSNPHDLVVFRDRLYFTANDRVHGRDLWVTDGSAEGTELVADLPVGGDDRAAHSLVVVGTRLYFAAGDDRHTLWTSDGSLTGTRQVTDRVAVSEYRGAFSVANLGGVAYFAGDDASGVGLWRTDGTDAGTDRVWRGGVFGLVRSEDTLFFASGCDLVASDGTRSGTRVVRRVGDEAPEPTCEPLSGLTAFGAGVVFVANDGLHGYELWISDGTSQGTRMVRDVLPVSPTGTGGPYSGVGNLTVLGDKVLFSEDDGVHGREPWISDGTEAGTRLLRDIEPGPGISEPVEFVVHDGLAFFPASDSMGRELWMTDGTEAGTRQVRDIRPGPDGNSFGWKAGVRDELFFVIWDVPTQELWATRGTAESTRPLEVLNDFRELTPFEDRLAFVGVDDEAGAELWMSDGTSAGTHRVVDIASPSEIRTERQPQGTPSPAPSMTPEPTPQLVDGWALDGDARKWAPIVNATIKISGPPCPEPASVGPDGRFTARCILGESGSLVVKAYAPGFSTLARLYTYDRNWPFRAALRMPLEHLGRAQDAPLALMPALLNRR